MNAQATQVRVGEGNGGGGSRTSRFFFKILASSLFAMVGCEYHERNAFEEFYMSWTKEEFPPVEKVRVEPYSLERCKAACEQEKCQALGYSSFRGPSEDRKLLVNHARRIGANLVMLQGQEVRTVTVPFTRSVPIITHQYGSASAQGPGGYATGDYFGTSTTYVPQVTYMPVAIVDQYAAFLRDDSALTEAERKAAAKWYRKHGQPRRNEPDG